MAALVTIWHGTTAFWSGYNSLVPTVTNTAGGLMIFAGIMLFILGIIVILVIDILRYGDATLQKMSVFTKFYRFEVLLILGVIILLLEFVGINFAVAITGTDIWLLGGLLLIIAGIMEAFKKKEMKASKLMALIGCVFAVINIIGLFASGTTQTIFDGILGIIIVILLLLSMFEKIKFIPYQWWMVLILGFILWAYLIGIAGILVLISFILMLAEK
ncbi:MAG: hypothetical protein JW891_00370 [Candidatus Lokiarchaeota archaeon]|nr:hypothetical protein [Candidatus Lokiarchaeota archaeon]